LRRAGFIEAASSDDNEMAARLFQQAILNEGMPSGTTFQSRNYRAEIREETHEDRYF
jgi:hypothetical protein